MGVCVYFVVVLYYYNGLRLSMLPVIAVYHFSIECMCLFDSVGLNELLV